MQNTRRSFFKSATALLVLTVVRPAQLFARQIFPDVEDGVPLRKVYRNGKRIRMSDLKKGDTFQMEEDGRRWSCVADSDPFKTPVAIGDERMTWTVQGRTLE
jgi:hypothetical protein